MSIRVMNAVFKAPLPPAQKVVALALADHAHDDGTEARPGIASLSVKCTLSERQVIRILKSLVEKNILFIHREGVGRAPNCYRFHLDEYDRLTVPNGDNLSLHDSSSGDISKPVVVTSEARSGDTGVTQTIRTTKEPPLSSSNVANDAQLVDVANAPSSIESHFDRAWKMYPRKVARKSALKAYTATVKAKKATHEQLLSASEVYAATRVGEPENFTMHGATFFGPSERWRDYVTSRHLDDATVSRRVADTKREMKELEQRRMDEHAKSVPMPESMKRFKQIGA